jgi:tRNA threonylcarbamoyladenosine biosynthesis protein TsaE
MKRRQKTLAKIEEYTSYSADETFQIAANLAKGFQGNEVVLLFGELGAGKTVFAKGIASGLAFEDIHSVSSPSYTLVNIYKARSTMYHVDLYRLGGEAEILDLGWEDFIGNGVVVVEWGEKLPFPLEGIRVTLAVLEDETRKITIEKPLN